jgi:hypothetical protein
MSRKGKRNISAEGQELLEDKDIRGNETVLHGVIHESRKRERSNEDGLFMTHQKGPITSTLTVDWFLREGQQIRRPKKNATGELIHIPNERLDPQNHEGKRIRCDLCRTLWIAECRFRTEKDLPEQTLGHIQHTWEALPAAHIDDHHQCW